MVRRYGAHWTPGHAIGSRSAPDIRRCERRNQPGGRCCAQKRALIIRAATPQSAGSHVDKSAFRAYLYPGIVRAGDSAPGVADDALEDMQLAMQEMFGAGNHDNRQLLRSRPVVDRRD